MHYPPNHHEHSRLRLIYLGNCLPVFLTTSHNSRCRIEDRAWTNGNYSPPNTQHVVVDWTRSGECSQQVEVRVDIQPSLMLFLGKILQHGAFDFATMTQEVMHKKKIT